MDIVLCLNFFLKSVKVTVIKQKNLTCEILELDFKFVSWLTSQVREMRTKHVWQPALRKLFSIPSPDDRRAALQFLLEAMKKFQVT